MLTIIKKFRGLWIVAIAILIVTLSLEASVAQKPTVSHPLDPLTEAEIKANELAYLLLRQRGDC